MYWVLVGVKLFFGFAIGAVLLWLVVKVAVVGASVLKAIFAVGSAVLKAIFLEIIAWLDDFGLLCNKHRVVTGISTAYVVLTLAMLGLAWTDTADWAFLPAAVMTAGALPIPSFVLYFVSRDREKRKRDLQTNATG